MTFEYFAGEQRSPEWFKIRLAKPTASRLSDWLAVAKKDGKPLKARKDYEKEIRFEKTFDTSFERFISSAMQEGIDYEDFARRQYEEITGQKVKECGAWYNNQFCASPDGTVNDDGLVEIKWLKDTNWTEVLETQEPLSNHLLQMQGQMMASDRKWTDYIAGNLNTRKLIIVRVERDEETIKLIEESLVDFDVPQPYQSDKVFDFVDTPPVLEVQETPKLDIGF